MIDSESYLEKFTCAARTIIEGAMALANESNPRKTLGACHVALAVNELHPEILFKMLDGKNLDTVDYIGRRATEAERLPSASAALSVNACQIHRSAAQLFKTASLAASETARSQIDVSDLITALVADVNTRSDAAGDDAATEPMLLIIIRRILKKLSPSRI